jgi:hypothetical protein
MLHTSAAYTSDIYPLLFLTILMTSKVPLLMLLTYYLTPCQYDLVKMNLSMTKMRPVFFFSVRMHGLG